LQRARRRRQNLRERRKTFAKGKGDRFFALEFIDMFHDRLKLVRGGGIE
jgi:hypothetical protein